MKFEITVRHFKLKEEEKAYIDSKINKMGKSLPIDFIDLVIDQEKYLYKIEMNLKTLNKKFFIKKEDRNLTALIDLVTDKMEYQLNKYKGKIKEHHIREKNISIVENEEKKDFFKIKFKELEKLSDEEALDKIKQKKETFLVYKDITNGIISVIFEDANNEYNIYRYES